MTVDPRILAFCLDAAARRAPARAFVIGVSGPQGGGKSTLTAGLVSVMRERGLRAATVSIDDFYLTHAEQRALAAAHPGDRCLEHRGYPGTHDVALGDRVLSALATQREGRIEIPAYDKSAHEGRGDRAPRARFQAVEAPLDVVFLEGWMLGFRRLSDADCPPLLRATNDCLPPYARWYGWLDAFVHLVAEHTSFVVDYRVDAERARRAAGLPALSDEDARDYIERFLPAYDAYVPPLVDAPVCTPWLRAILGPDRRVRAVASSGSAPPGDAPPSE